MAEETQDIKQPEGEATPPQYSDTEQRAMSQGWVPKDEWDGDPDQWRPAKEFLDRGELFKKIDEQNRTIKEFKRVLDEFGKHHSQVRKVEYERALADLKAAKKEALVEGDADAVIDIDEKMQLVREKQKEAEASPAAKLPEPSVSENNVVFRNWVDRNGWYENNKAMRAYADRIGNELGSQGGMSPTDILAAVEREVKKEFAHKFENPNRAKPGAVEGGGAKGSGKRDTFVPTEEERRVARRFAATIPGYTEEQYYSELKKTRGV